MICSGSKPAATLALQTFRQSRLNESDVSGLSEIEHSLSKASGNSPLRNSLKSLESFSSDLSPGAGLQEMSCLSA